MKSMLRLGCRRVGLGDGESAASPPLRIGHDSHEVSKSVLESMVTRFRRGPLCSKIKNIFGSELRPSQPPPGFRPKFSHYRTQASARMSLASCLAAARKELM